MMIDNLIHPLALNITESIHKNITQHIHWESDKAIQNYNKIFDMIDSNRAFPNILSAIRQKLKISNYK